MAEVLIKRSPDQGSEDFDFGLIWEDSAGEVIGLYGHNNTKTTWRIALSLGARTEELTLSPDTVLRQRFDLPVGRRVALRQATESDHPWQIQRGWVPGFDSISVRRAERARSRQPSERG